MAAMTFTRALGIGLSAWELTALTTRRIPALTDVLRYNPILGALATGWVAAHLLSQQTP